MTKQLIVNLPVASVEASRAFFGGLGFEFDPDFSDENGTSMLVNENAFVLLLARPFFEGFSPRGVADPAQGAEAIVSVGVESREEVDRLVDGALAAGARAHDKASVDDGFMYSRGFADLDGHLWEVIHMSAPPA